MNIVQLHEKTKFYLDSVRSPRFPKEQIDKAINTSITDAVNSRYDDMRKQQDPNKAFQATQRMRDELYTIVVNADVSTLTISGNTILTSSLPTDYWIMALLKVNISGTGAYTIPLTYDEMSVIELNPFRRPSLDYPSRVYRIESSTYIDISFGNEGALTSVESMYYLKLPDEVSIGTAQSTGNVANATAIIAKTDCIFDLLDAGGGSIGTKTLSIGKAYVVGTDGEVTLDITSGTVVYNYTNTDLPNGLHDEICRRAAAVLSENVENYDRATSIDQDVDPKQ